MNDRTGWLRYAARPLLLAAMLGIVGVALAQLAALFMPGWDGQYVPALFIFLVIEVHLSHQFLRRRKLRGGDVLRYRLAEALLLFFVARLLRYLVPSGWGRWEELAEWVPQPELVVMDSATWAVYLIMLVLWQSIHSTLDDFARIDGAVREEAGRYSLNTVLQDRLTLRQEQRETSTAHQSLFNRFLQGGVVLLLITGITLVSVNALTNLSRPPVSGMVWTVGLYFLCGLMMTGLLRYVALRRKWQAEYVSVDRDVARGWLFYLALLLLLGVAAALLMPTGYSLPILGSLARAIETLFSVMAFIGLLLFAVVTFPVVWGVWFLTALLGNESEAPRFTPPPPPPPVAAPMAEGMNWLEFARAAGLWLLLIALIWFTVGTYLRDKNLGGRYPRLAALLERLRAWLNSLSVRWRGATRSVAARLRQGIGGRRDAARPRARRTGVTDPVIALYIRLVRRAEAVGVHREGSATAYEFNEQLRAAFPEVEGHLDQLTDGFVEARYSQHPTTEERVGISRRAWTQVREAMSRRPDR